MTRGHSKGHSRACISKSLLEFLRIINSR
uniref:Uncharacterized protein n=1 Tax=Anguilla anguilla TaxID=7936 RepID=A0A0E9RXI8_ANGAN